MFFLIFNDFFDIFFWFKIIFLCVLFCFNFGFGFIFIFPVGAGQCTLIPNFEVWMVIRHWYGCTLGSIHVCNHLISYDCV